MILAVEHDLSDKTPVFENPQQQQLFETFNAKFSNAAHLFALATNKPGVTLNVLNDSTVQIKAGILWDSTDNIINSGNTVAPSVRLIATEIYEMMQKNPNLSVDIETFVGKQFILSRINHYPNSDLGDGIKDACETRSSRAKQWINTPDNKGSTGQLPITIHRGTSVSDVHDLIYTIKFGPANK